MSGCLRTRWKIPTTKINGVSAYPMRWKLDETIRGHVFCSFLALVLKAALEDRIAALGRSGSWPEIHRRSGFAD
jgi:hypothetical protein